MSIHLDEEAPSFDPESRRLCGDPACLGVIRDDGRCSECGRIGEGEEPHKTSFPDDAGEAAVSATAASTDDTSDDEDGDSDEDSAAAAPNETGTLEDRRLCVDPSCIGVLDAEGRCCECGRSVPVGDR